MSSTYCVILLISTVFEKCASVSNKIQPTKLISIFKKSFFLLAELETLGWCLLTNVQSEKGRKGKCLGKIGQNWKKNMKVRKKRERKKKRKVGRGERNRKREDSGWVKL